MSNNTDVLFDRLMIIAGAMCIVLCNIGQIYHFLPTKILDNSVFFNLLKITHIGKRILPNMFAKAKIIICILCSNLIQ